MLNLLAVFVGGGLGACARYGATVLFVGMRWGGLPAGTLAVNVAASLLVGLAFGLFESRAQGLSPAVRLALTCGFCGGLSTFSTFAFEALTLWKQTGLWAALWYALASTVLCVAAAALGFWLGR